MPQPKDFLKYLPSVKAVVSIVNPIYGAGVDVLEAIFIKPKEKAMKALEGKKTYIGIAVTALAFIAQFMGYDIDLEAQDGLKTSIAEITQAVGILIATYGRVKTTKK